MEEMIAGANTSFQMYPALARGAAEVIEAGKAAKGHIFNLGHGVIPSTDPDQLTRLTEFVQGYAR